jgi:hypothetical protein
MPAPLFLIWHQFIKETREHRNSLIGILLIAGAYTTIAATGILENIQTSWNYPLLTQNPILPFMFTLVPGLLLVPFLAFADSCSEPDAFWVTKPLGTMTVVGAKVLWISVWLIGLPLIGEGIVVVSLSGTEHLAPVMFDFVLIRAAYFFTAFALATLFNQIFHFTIAALCIPFIGAILAACMTTFSPEISRVARNSPMAISELLIWCVSLPIIAIFVACFQYRYRVDIKRGTLCVLSVVAVCSVLTSKPVDLLDHSIPIQQSQALGTDQIAINLHSSHVVPTTLNPQNHSTDQLELDISIANTPPLTTLLLNQVRLTIETAERKVVLEDNYQTLKCYTENSSPTERVFNEIISHLKEETNTRHSIAGKITVSFPPGEKANDWKGRVVSITGAVRFDLFDHYEFGRLEPNLAFDHKSSITALGTSIVMHWPKKTPTSLYISFIYRHIASNNAFKHSELRSRWNPMVIPWYFVFRDQKNNTYWEQLEGQVNEYCGGSSFCALHIGRSTATLPLGINVDEVIVYGSRYLGTVHRTFTMNDITLQLKD